jgi:outer membrane biosynthesis protein TonB
MDLFASAPQSPPSTGGLFSDDSGLFGPGQASVAEEFTGVSDIFSDSGPSAAAGLFGAQEPVKGGTSPRISAEQMMMTGQRNESSVLFSLSSLQSLAAAQEAKKNPVVTNTGGSEGSGLIDIRALAGNLKQIEPETPSKQDDDLFSLGGGFGGGLSAPVLAPTRQVGMGTGAKAGIIAGIVLVLTLVVVVGVLLWQQRQPKETSPEVKSLLEKIATLEKGGGGSSAQMAELKAELAQAQATPEPAKVGPQEGVVAEAPKDEPKVADKDARPRDRSAPRATGPGTPSPSPDKPVAAPSDPLTVPTREDKPPPQMGQRSPRGPPPRPASSTIFSASPKASPPAAKKPAEPAAAPKTATPAAPASAPSSSGDNSGTKDSLDRMDVQNGMSSVAAAVKQCGQGEQGTVTLQIVIGPTGRVTSAEPTGTFAGTPVGACAARAVRTARFPATKSSLSVRYPFKL